MKKSLYKNVGGRVRVRRKKFSRKFNKLRITNGKQQIYLFKNEHLFLKKKNREKNYYRGQD